MDFIKENFEIITSVLLVLIIILAIFLTNYVLHISKYFSNRKFRILGRYEYEPQTADKEFVIQVFNNNVNDSRIVGFGFIYKEQSIDYFKTYAILNGLDPLKQVIVLSRDSIELHVPSKELETIVSDYNKGKKHVSMIKVYAIDFQGIVTRSKAKSIRKIVAINLKNDLRKQNKIKKEYIKNNKIARKQEKKNHKMLERYARKEKFSKWWLIFRTKFKRKVK